MRNLFHDIGHGMINNLLSDTKFVSFDGSKRVCKHWELKSILHIMSTISGKKELSPSRAVNLTDFEAGARTKNKKKRGVEDPGGEGGRGKKGGGEEEKGGEFNRELVETPSILFKIDSSGNQKHIRELTSRHCTFSPLIESPPTPREP